MSPEWFDAVQMDLKVLLSQGARICIIGGPRTGKTTLAGTMENVLHTDDLIDKFDWSGVSEFVATDWLARPGPWVIEGVAVVRALRKWLAANADGAPCEKIIVLTEPRVELSKHQAAMAKGHEKVWREVRPLLLARGVVVGDR
jgi:energy-coupling factor transporter ATP-binding protein EcfA2